MDDYTFKSLYSDEIFSFSWDIKTGEISGPGKPVIGKLMEQGEIITPPPGPKLYTIPEKITDTDMMSSLVMVSNQII